MMVNSFRTRAAISTAGAAVVVALTAGTAIAGADAIDDAFVATLQKLGLTESPNTARALGLSICGDLVAGRTPTAVDPEFTPNGAAIIVAAKQAYCPTARLP